VSGYKRTRRYREANPDACEREKRRNAARQRALVELSRAYPDAFRALYHGELARSELIGGCSCRCHQTVQPGLVPCPSCAQPQEKRPEPPSAGAPAMVSATPTSGPPGKHEDLAPTVPEEHA
jgi:hypothetical protein